MRFQGKVVFITGGSKGLGKALTLKFLEEGAVVGVNGREKEALDALGRECNSERLRLYEGDISDYKRMEDIAEEFVSSSGGVDILINNASIMNPLVPSERIRKEDFDRVIDINLKGTFYATLIFGRKMIERGSGRIVSISSQAGLFGEKGFLPYAISKGSVMLMTRILAYEWAKYGVTLCCLAPGFIKGGMNEKIVGKREFVEFLSSRTPIGRMAEVEEFVSLVLFLSSPEASYINGETIIMDGGMTGYVKESLLDFISSMRKER